MRHRTADRPVRERRINTRTQPKAAVRDAQPGAKNVQRGADRAAQRTDGRVIGCDTSPSSSSALPCTTNHRRAAAMRCELPNLYYLYIPRYVHLSHQVDRMSNWPGHMEKTTDPSSWERWAAVLPCRTLPRSCSAAAAPFKDGIIRASHHQKKKKKKENNDAPACFGKTNPGRLHHAPQPGPGRDLASSLSVSPHNTSGASSHLPPRLGAAASSSLQRGASALQLRRRGALISINRDR